MSNDSMVKLGSVTALWRYPVKSMLGEELNASELTPAGLLGDRVYALIDRSNGKAASAKNPRKWPNLFDFRAAFIDPPGASQKAAPVRITLPDGRAVRSEQRDIDQILSQVLQREVTLASIEPKDAAPPSISGNARLMNVEEYWPDLAGLEHRDAVTDFVLPRGTFFDSATILLLTTHTLARLSELYPAGRFEVRRFRPNIVVTPESADEAFTENAWVGRTLALGEDVRLSITRPCGRCVMTTLPQGDLPRDLGILRTAAQYNHAQVGVYADVLQGGTLRRGDTIRFE
jgi:uncharacterized protein YcbX